MAPLRSRLMVADDHPVVRAGLVAMVEREADLCVVCEAADGRQAVEAWRAAQPDVGLVDLNMPGLDGLQAVREIIRFDASARLVVLTALGGDEDVFRALEAGARGYLLKDCGREELVRSIRAVMHGQKYLQAGAAHMLAERMTATVLTAREREVLERLAQGLSNKQISAQLLVTEGTVKAHVRNVLQKLNVSSRTQAVRLAVKRGLVRLPQAGSGGD
ncbi:MAG: response regulator transcription factor [Chitinophagaceae bacterium]|nr:response regulator transcription factor [Rubrivivax sp.]